MRGKIPKSLKFNPEWKSLNPLNWSDTVIYHPNFVDLVVPDLTWALSKDVVNSRKLFVIEHWRAGGKLLFFMSQLPRWTTLLWCCCPWPIPKYFQQIWLSLLFMILTLATSTSARSERLEAIVNSWCEFWHEFHLQNSQNNCQETEQFSLNFTFKIISNSEFRSFWHFE